ncbi:hypothetical protein SteCoe_23835 [Stentor coeruleus]|uniref:Uncharacterized protein n=1 Tax=Stentor coeruleus TaxID=5963 RepID=A0A1R2BIX3_9CILI|nr:hypothetical protein SteCoe_23835 [Stentor coeruleus]
MQVRYNLHSRQDKSRGLRNLNQRKSPTGYDQSDHENTYYTQEDYEKRKGRRFKSLYEKPMSPDVVQRQSAKYYIDSLVSRRLKSRYDLSNNNKLPHINRIKHSLFPYVIEEENEENDEVENTVKKINEVPKTPDPRKRYANSLFF